MIFLLVELLLIAFLSIIIYNHQVFSFCFRNHELQNLRLKKETYIKTVIPKYPLTWVNARPSEKNRSAMTPSVLYLKDSHY